LTVYCKTVQHQPAQRNENIDVTKDLTILAYARLEWMLHQYPMIYLPAREVSSDTPLSAGCNEAKGELAESPLIVNGTVFGVVRKVDRKLCAMVSLELAGI
jgi:hypothetical protein